MDKKHVQTVLRAKAERYEYFCNAQQQTFRSQLTKALTDKNMGAVIAAKELIVEFNIYHPTINPQGNY